ncbi:MAG: bifunctional adenosylcobinamide kinase/adenosylcobinamide-phosphate guanylyltransferase [Chitinispirillaceae bacterium]
MGSVTLVTGGVRSGKSAWAIKRGEAVRADRRIFIATARALDEEMRERVRSHRQERGGRWDTVEAECDLANVVDSLPDGTVAVIDCCTVWLGNVWHLHGNSNENLEKHVKVLCDALDRWKRCGTGEIIIVSNEVGWGIVPLEPEVRRYRDWAGRLNQRIAALAQKVYLSVAGIPVKIKG